MILADTSIWVHHFRSSNADLQRLLTSGRIVIHPFVTAELALGSLKNRAKTLDFLHFLPQVRVAQHKEVLQMIEVRSLHSRGIGLIDAHLVAATLINPPTQLWTRDKRLRAAATALGIHATLR